MPFATAAPILALLCANEIPKRWSTLVRGLWHSTTAYGYIC
jgi:hypothetical protein